MNFRRWFQPVAYAPWETALMRLFFGIAVYYAYGKIQTFPSAETDVGLARWFDLAVFHQPEWREPATSALLPKNWFHLVVGVCMAVFAWGRFAWLALPIAGVLFLGAGTLNTSQGSTQHHLQVGTTALLVLALWYFGRALWQRFRDKSCRLEKTHQLAPFFVLQVLAAAYVLAGISKLKKSGIGWVSDAKYAPVSLRKTADQDYFSVTDHLPPASLSWMEKLPHLVQSLFLEHPWVASLFMGPGLLLELLAVLALVGRKSALIVGALLIGFHYMISEVMNLHFEMNNHLIAIFCLNLPFWLWLGSRRVLAAKK